MVLLVMRTKAPAASEWVASNRTPCLSGRRRRPSTTTHEVDDLQNVPLAQASRGVRAAWDDVAVALHGDPLLGQLQAHQQVGDGQPFGHLTRLAVDSQLHAISLDSGV